MFCSVKVGQLGSCGNVADKCPRGQNSSPRGWVLLSPLQATFSGRGGRIFAHMGLFFLKCNAPRTPLYGDPILPAEPQPQFTHVSQKGEHAQPAAVQTAGGVSSQELLSQVESGW